MLYKNGHGFTQIALKMGVSRQRIHQIVTNYKNFGIKRFNKKEKKELNKKKICEICRQPAINFHHKDRDNDNDSIENLLAVCKKCHYELHRGEKRIYNGRILKTKKKLERLYLWSLKYKECQKCLTTEYKHVGHGLCAYCYQKNYLSSSNNL